MALQIRPLRRSDYQAMIALFRVSGLNPKTKGRDSPRSFSEQLRRNRSSYLGAFDGDRLAGVVLGTSDTRKAWINVSQSIRTIVVDRSRAGSCERASASFVSKDSRCSRH